jgi:hypothetical protein
VNAQRDCYKHGVYAHNPQARNWWPRLLADKSPKIVLSFTELQAGMKTLLDEC